jgi:hypothetical protein
MNFRMYAIYLGAVKLVSATIVELWNPSRWIGGTVVFKWSNPPW